MSKECTSICRLTPPEVAHKNSSFFGTSKLPHVPLALLCSTHESRCTKKRILRQHRHGATHGGGRCIIIQKPCILWIGFKFDSKNNVFCRSDFHATCMRQQYCDCTPPVAAHAKKGEDTKSIVRRPYRDCTRKWTAFQKPNQHRCC